MSFNYQGHLSSSKSLFNRALIVQSHFPELVVRGESQCDDVRKMKRALQLFAQGESLFDCGAAGTTLRFLLARVSREEGVFDLTGDERLFERPHQGLIDVLSQLGVQVERPEKNILRVRSQGWSLPEKLSIDFSKSSQFGSAILLNAWNLQKPLRLVMSSRPVSLAYFAMTLNLVKELGMDFDVRENEILILPEQKLKEKEYAVEPDMSSTFTVAAFAALKGRAQFERFPLRSLQPDAGFMRLFKKMGIPLEFTGSSLVVRQADTLKAVHCRLSDTPDLFPVLAVLLSQANGSSVVTGIDHLAFKESNRIENTLSLLSCLGRKARYDQGRFTIEGKAEKFSTGSLEFDCDQDHRMAMAAALAQRMGATIEVKGGQPVEKSFPDFWQVLEKSEAAL